jgi:subtilisin family serine protease
VTAFFVSVLAVGAVTETDARAPFSNFGGPLDLIAPGGGGSSPAGAIRPDRSVLSLLALDSPFGVLCDEDSESVRSSSNHPAS